MGALLAAGSTRQDHRAALLVFAATGTALVVAYFAVPADSLEIRLGASVWALSAFAFGLRTYRPRHPEAWLLLAAALAVFQVADASDFGLPASTKPGGADWISYVGYPLAAAGLVLMVRSRTVGRDVAGFLDALIAALALAFPTWLYVVQPLVGDAALPVAVRVASVVPPIGDVVLVGIIARLLVASATRSVSVWLLSAGVVVCAIADCCAGLWRLNAVPWFGTSGGQTLMAAGWMGYCLLWGAAALVPSMRENTLPARGATSDVLPARIAALTALALVAPVVAYVQEVREGPMGGGLGLILGTAVFLLVIIRIGLVIANHRHALDSEQALLEASESLAEASSAGQVAATLDRTVGRLFGSGARHRSVVAVADQGRIRVAPAGRHSPGPALGGGVDPAGAAGTPGTPNTPNVPGTPNPTNPTTPTVADTDAARWRSILAETARAVPPDAEPAGLVAADALPQPLAGALSGFRQAIALPLGTADDPWREGVLAVSASEHAVLMHAASLEILAGQAAMCLTRIDLNREIARRDGARYFRALVQHDSDAILIVDPDRRSATRALGRGPVRPRRGRRPGPGDLIGPDNAAEVARAWPTRRGGRRCAGTGAWPRPAAGCARSRPPSATCAPSRPSPAWWCRCATSPTRGAWSARCSGRPTGTR